MSPPSSPNRSPAGRPADDLVPVIDLLRAEADAEERARLDSACRDHGFFLLANHGIQPQIDAMWEASARFFAQSSAAKRKLMRSAEQPLGYYDRELTKRMRDQKEVFDFMPTRANNDRNQWPKNQPGFRAAMESFTAGAGELAQRTLQLIYSCLASAPESGALAALPKGEHKNSNIRLNYYPESDPLTSEEATTINALGSMALHHHTDPGILTLLVQDSVGGLQTESLSHGWIDVPPVKDTIVVNLGDAMQVWTNDTYRAAIHRVTPMQGQPRYSTPYFLSPQSDAVLEPLPALSNGAPIYRSFTWKDFIQARVSDNFADLGEDDTQISHYRLA